MPHLITASQLHHLRSKEAKPIQVERGTAPTRKFASIWPMSSPLYDRSGKNVGDHFMFDGGQWMVGTRDELIAAFKGS